MGLYGNDFDPTREWELRRLQVMLQRKPEIARAPEPHGISYWCWVVVDAVVNVVAILLAATLFALPLLLIARVDRLGVVFVALAVSGQLGGLAVLIGYPFA